MLCLALLLSAFGCDRDEPEDPAATGGPMLPEAEAVAEEVLEVADDDDDPGAEPGEGAAIAVGDLPTRVASAISVVAVAERGCRPGAVYFDTDSAELDDDAKADLDQLAECLEGTREDEDVTLRGRADPRAGEDYNEQLGRQRATAVASYLQTEGGVDESDFTIRAVGEDGATEGMPELWSSQRNTTIRPE
tara:strand:- start:6170 stop:6742 length:573 start_codon:yes stop_codon:yes gene_type:complete